MPYHRDAAIAYARKYWDRPCDDGVFWCKDHVVDVASMRKANNAPAKDGWEARFVPDAKGAEQAVFQRSKGAETETIVIQKWEGLADCAHFLSRCMHAGGLPISEISVPSLVNHLKRRQDVKTLAEQLTREQGQRIVDAGLLKEGDMVGYFNIDPNGDWGGRQQYSHSTMYVGKIGSGDVGRITCHTKSRFAGLSSHPDQWHLDVNSYTYSFLHFAHDDAPPWSVTSKLIGWWKKADNANGYYYLSPNGGCRFSMLPPTEQFGPPGISMYSGYWFLKGSVVTFVWNPGALIDVWRPAGPDQFATELNGSPRLGVVKMKRGRHR